MTMKRHVTSYIPDVEEDIEIELAPEVVVVERQQKNLIGVIDPTFLSVYLDCLTADDKKRIVAKHKHEGESRGSMVLIDCLVRRKNFWQNFHDALKDEDVGLSHLSELLEEDMEKYKEEQKNKLQENLEGQSISIQTVVQDEVVGTDEPLSKIRKVKNATSDQKTESSKEEPLQHIGSPIDAASVHAIRKKIERLELTDSKQPRKYQLALADLAIEGHNTIICAPPGSGKTLVALLICKAHLEKKFPKTQNKTKQVLQKGIDVKVIVVVPRHAILMQWYRECKTMFPLFQVAKRSGVSQKDNVPLDIAMKVYDVLIVTAEIFKNAIIDDKIVEITSATLIIFDECHHTVENHPYNMIMNAYMKVKIKEPNKKLPQIVGLSASPGAGKKVMYAAGENKIMTLCANLDTEFIVTVPVESQDEVDQHSPQSMRHVKFAESRPDNPFTSEIRSTMIGIEKHIDMHNIEDFTRGKQEYNPKIERVFEKARSEDNDTMRKCAEHLLEYNKVLELVDLVKLDEGIKQLEKFYRSFQERSSCGQLDETETYLLNIYTSLKGKLQEYAVNENEYPSPKLEMLKTSITQLYRKCTENDQEFRGIIFVQTKVLAEALQESLLSEVEINRMNPKVFVSANKSGDSGARMTKTEQDEILDDFKNGKVKLLISTSILDEGVDIEFCNMTVDYSRTTNAITMVQCDGRARSQNSINISIGGEQIVEKNEVNLVLVQIMEQAIKNIIKIQEVDPKFYKQQIQAKQVSAVSRREMKTQETNLLQNQNTPEEIEFRCKGCETIVCKASDIRVIDSTNFVNISEEFRTLVRFCDHSDPNKKQLGIQKIFCVKCRSDWGNTCESYPCLKIKSFVILAKGQVRKVKQWKHMPCKILPHDGYAYMNTMTSE